jgi:hypothetical protein
VFDDGNIPAAFAKDTQRMFLPKGCPGSLFEYLHFDPADILAHPLIKDGAEKSGKRFRGHRVGADAALGIGLWLDQGQESDVLGLELLEKPVHLKRISDVVGIDHTKDFAQYLVLL